MVFGIRIRLYWNLHPVQIPGAARDLERKYPDGHPIGDIGIVDRYRSHQKNQACTIQVHAEFIRNGLFYSHGVYLVLSWGLLRGASVFFESIAV